MPTNAAWISWQPVGRYTPLKGYRWGGTSVAIRGDCTRIVSRGNDGTVRVWDAESGLEKLILKESAGRVTSVAIRSDSTRIDSRGYDG
jgi:WD40 repeat protein